MSIASQASPATARLLASASAWHRPAGRGGAVAAGCAQRRALGLGADGWFARSATTRVQAALELSLRRRLARRRLHRCLVGALRDGVAGGALPLPGAAACRMRWSTSVRLADRGRRHRADRDLRAERFGGQVVRRTRHQDRLRWTRGHRHRLGLHRPCCAVRTLPGAETLG